jgi:hypothetical protein
MTKSDKLYEVLYVSTIAPNAPLSIIADIAKKSRQANKQRDITGLLIFDGMRFGQQLEGKRGDVLVLLERIVHDPRHVNIEVLHQAPLAERRFGGFSLGYTTADDGDELGRLEKMQGRAALDAFLALQARADLGPDSAC